MKGDPIQELKLRVEYEADVDNKELLFNCGPISFSSSLIRVDT